MSVIHSMYNYPAPWRAQLAMDGQTWQVTDACGATVLITKFSLVADYAIEKMQPPKRTGADVGVPRAEVTVRLAW